ncbi:hypothetical protein AVEN_242187-1 [Araneus ventricosus]|uniref:Uncharacterized protein n=1 Tax=Araneus ventricosus TaxID=182803 RepID=A0A4Y2DFY5_ARAVE|nr:hypothetical protein AVEN_242187-1 [Araneus ventricosus]
MAFRRPGCEASGKTIVLPGLRPRFEARNETRNPPCGRGCRINSHRAGLRRTCFETSKFTPVVVFCSNLGCGDQSVTLIKISWNGSPASKRSENPLVLVINNSLVVIGFDEMTPQNNRTMTMKRSLMSNHHQPKQETL